MLNAEWGASGGLKFKAFCLFSVLMTLIVTTSCGSMRSVSKKFQPTVVANVGVFADQTIAMLSESDFGFSADRSIYLRDFLSVNNEIEAQLVAYKFEAGQFFRKIMDYSMGLVLIVENNPEEVARVAAYADFISQIKAEVLEKLDLDENYYEQILENVRAAETFLEALRQAQPIVNGAGRHMNQVLDNLFRQVELLSIDLERRIDNRFEDVVRYQRALELEKYAILKAMEKLFHAADGDKAAYKALIESRAVTRRSLVPAGEPTEAELEAIWDHLVDRLDNLDRVMQEVQPDWKLYRATHRELDNVKLRITNNISRARLITLVWLRAHQKMASGVTNPAEWFDIRTLPKQLLNMGVKTFL
jgi:hypothetical protein